MKTMWVIALPGQWAPSNGEKRGRITDKVPVEVPVDRYYSRLVQDGSLKALSADEASALLNPPKSKKAGRE